MRKTIVALLLFVVALPVLAQDRERITANLDRLGSLGCGERKAEYLAFSRDQQLELWTAHLQKFLATHPQLTDTQRSVVFEGLGMIASGALYRTEDQAAQNLVKSFEQRAARQFDPETFKDAFVRLGGRPTPATGAKRPAHVRTLQPYCDCDGEEDCGGGPCDWFHPCTEIIACGPFGMDWCLGVCE